MDELGGLIELEMKRLEEDVERKLVWVIEWTRVY